MIIVKLIRVIMKFEKEKTITVLNNKQENMVGNFAGDVGNLLFARWAPFQFHFSHLLSLSR